MSQVSCWLLRCGEHPFNCCSHVRDCRCFLVRNCASFKRFYLDCWSFRRGLYMMLAMGSFPVGIIALSVLASRVQVLVSCFSLQVFLTQRLPLPLITFHPTQLRNGDCWPPWYPFLVSPSFSVIGMTDKIQNFVITQNFLFPFPQVPDRKSSMVPQPSTDSWSRSSPALYCQRSINKRNPVQQSILTVW